MQSAGHSHKQVVRRTQHFERLISFVVDWKSKRLCWMQSQGRSQVQVAHAYGKDSFEARSHAAPLQASTVWNIHESPWLIRANGFTHIPKEIKNDKCLARS